MGARCNLTDCHASAIPRDDMTAIGNINLGLETRSLNTPTLVNRVEFGMQ